MAEKTKEYKLNGAEIKLTYYESPFHATHPKDVADKMVNNFDRIKNIKKILNKMKLQHIPEDLLDEIEYDCQELYKTYKDLRKLSK